MTGLTKIRRVSAFLSWCIVALIATLQHAKSDAIEITPEELSTYYGVYQRLLSATGTSQRAPVLLMEDASLILWAQTNGKVGLVRTEGMIALCELVDGDPTINFKLFSTLEAMPKAQQLESSRLFADGVFISSEFTALFNAVNKDFPADGCEIVVYSVAGDLMAAIATDVREAMVTEIALILAGKRFDVAEAQGSFLLKSENRERLREALRSSDIAKIVSFGEFGLVGLQTSGEPFAIEWDGGRRISLMTWHEASSIIEDQRDMLFTDAALSLITDSDSYYRLLGSIAFGETNWRGKIRQAPQIVFRKWT